MPRRTPKQLAALLAAAAASIAGTPALALQDGGTTKVVIKDSGLVKPAAEAGVTVVVKDKPGKAADDKVVVLDRRDADRDRFDHYRFGRAARSLRATRDRLKQPNRFDRGFRRGMGKGLRTATRPSVVIKKSGDDTVVIASRPHAGEKKIVIDARRDRVRSTTGLRSFRRHAFRQRGHAGRLGARLDIRRGLHRGSSRAFRRGFGRGVSRGLRTGFRRHR